MYPASSAKSTLISFPNKWISLIFQYSVQTPLSPASPQPLPLLLHVFPLYCSCLYYTYFILFRMKTVHMYTFPSPVIGVEVGPWPSSGQGGLSGSQLEGFWESFPNSQKAWGGNDHHLPLDVVLPGNDAWNHGTHLASLMAAGQRTKQTRARWQSRKVERMLFLMTSLKHRFKAILDWGILLLIMINFP